MIPLRNLPRKPPWEIQLSASNNDVKFLNLLEHRCPALSKEPDFRIFRVGIHVRSHYVPASVDEHLQRADVEQQFKLQFCLSSELTSSSSSNSNSV